MSRVSCFLNIPPEAFYSPTRNRQGAWGWSIVAYIGGKLGGHQVKTLAEHFKRDPSVISRGIIKVERKRREEKVQCRKVFVHCPPLHGQADVAGVYKPF